MAAGIYAIENTSDGKRYVGSAVNTTKRWKDHLRLLGQGCHHSKHLQRAWDRSGGTGFRLLVLLVCDRSRLVFYEQRAIDGYHSADDRYGYNISPLAGSQLGFRHSPETRSHLADLKRGRKLSPEHKARISESGKQRYRDDPGLLAKQSKWLRGRPVSQETRDKIARLQIGRKHSPERIFKNSESHKGIKQSEETIAKRAATLRLVFQKPEVKARLSRAKLGNKNSLGYKQSPEHIAKRAVSFAETTRRRKSQR